MEQKVGNKHIGKTVKKVFKIAGFSVLAVVLAGLLINALLSVFMPHYYPTFGKYRLFAVVTDSMEGEIPTGSLIAARVPKSKDEITVGTVVTYEREIDKSIVLITHRVTAVEEQDGVTVYTTRGDNAGGVDAVRPTFENIVGVYTGGKCPKLGYVFGFLGSPSGAIALILIALVLIIAFLVTHFISEINVWRNAAVAALKKSGDMLSETENDGLVTISDVIGIATADPKTRNDVRQKDKKLKWFVRTGTLPKRPYKDELEVAPDSVAEMSVKLKLDTPVRQARALPTKRRTQALLPKPQGESTPRLPAAPETIVETDEKVGYVYTHAARLTQLKTVAKEWYVAVKNELLSYGGVRVRLSKRYERFYTGKRTFARLTVRGKTLCIAFFAVGDGASETVRITSARRLKTVLGKIETVAAALGLAQDPAYIPQDFYPAYAGVYTLMRRGLAFRRLSAVHRTYRIEEITDGKK